MFSDMKDIKMNEPDAFYTGGGIWCCAMYVDESHYYGMSSETDDVLMFFDAKGDDEADVYGFFDVIGEWTLEEMMEKALPELDVFWKMHDALLGKMKELSFPNEYDWDAFVKRGE